jgi:hypothetical protein
MRTLVYPNGPPGQLPTEAWWSAVHAQWSQLTRNVNEFTDHAGDTGKYQSWPLVVKNAARGIS